jgi:ubiquinone/menaquinone biosynthesis C-methylase UbiE
LKQANCNICGCNVFTLGWNGRLSLTGMKPTCEGCGSNERHRVSHNIYQLLPKAWFLRSRLLKISDDRSVDKTLFKDVEISVYGGQNSIDIENVDRPNKTYDWIICNHVLEHVEKDVQAVGEILRILKKSGVFQFMVPSPLRVEKTKDWGYADPELCDHYRTYGKDLKDRFSSVFKGYELFSHTGIDSVTNTNDIVYFVTMNQNFIEYFKNSYNFHSISIDGIGLREQKHSNKNNTDPLLKKITQPPSSLPYKKCDFNLTTRTELITWYKEHHDFVYFREKMIGFSEKDFMNSNLKLVQDLCICNFIKKNIKHGAKILEIGGGYSRILSFFEDKTEGWNLDKFEGIGNGPTKVLKEQKYTVLPAYIGSFDKKLPDAYFDLVFSISVLEHINDNDEILKNILNDIDRVLKPRGYSVHCIDCRFSPKSSPSIDNRRLAKYMILHYGYDPQYVIDNHKNDNVFSMSSKAYDRFWKKACNDRSYTQDGLPFNIFLAVQKK